VLQTTVFHEMPILGVKPELLYLVTIVIAMLDGPASGSIAGFASGMAEDFLLNQPKGITALSLTLLGYSVGLLRQYIVSPSPLLPTFLVAGGTFAGVLFERFVALLLGQSNLTWGYTLKVALLQSLYNAILTPLLYPVLRRAAEASRTQRVGRW